MFKMLEHTLTDEHTLTMMMMMMMITVADRDDKTR